MKFVNKLEVKYNTLIVFISALSEDENQLKAYEYGADDYITKHLNLLYCMQKCLALFKKK